MTVERYATANDSRGLRPPQPSLVQSLTGDGSVGTCLTNTTEIAWKMPIGVIGLRFTGSSFVGHETITTPRTSHNVCSRTRLLPSAAYGPRRLLLGSTR